MPAVWKLFSYRQQQVSFDHSRTSFTPDTAVDTTIIHNYTSSAVTAAHNNNYLQLHLQPLRFTTTTFTTTSWIRHLHRLFVRSIFWAIRRSELWRRRGRKENGERHFANSSSAKLMKLFGTLNFYIRGTTNIWKTGVGSTRRGGGEKWRKS